MSVTFCHLLQDQYNALENKDPDTIYFINDTLKLYLRGKNINGVSGMGHILGGYPVAVKAHTANTDGALITLGSVDDNELDMSKFTVDADIWFNLDNGASETEELLFQTHKILSVDSENKKIQIDGSLGTNFDAEKTFAMVQDPARKDNATTTGDKNFVTGLRSHAHGSWNTVVGMGAVAEGLSNCAIGTGVHAQGINCVASGKVTHAEGINCKANGLFSHAEGSSSTASGDNSHAEGSGCTASGDTSHADGANCTASGRLSRAFGSMAKAEGDYSAADGYQVTAKAKYSRVIGLYGELPDLPENQGAFALAGGEHEAKDIPFLFRCRKKALNPAYDPALDPESTGTDTNGEKQYIPVVAYSFEYGGRIQPKTMTFAAEDNIVLNHDKFARWNAAACSAVQPTLENWIDGDAGELVFSGTLTLPAEWIKVGSMENTRTINILQIEKVGDSIFCRLKY